MNAKKYSILISYLIGAPIGFLAVFAVIVLPTIISGEGITSLAIIGAYRNAIIGLLISFLFALGLAGKNAFDNLLKNNSLMIASLKYSLIVNLIIWPTFMFGTLASNTELFNVLFLIPPFIAFIISVLLTPITIGLLICYLIKRKIKSTTVISG